MKARIFRTVAVAAMLVCCTASAQTLDSLWALSYAVPSSNQYVCAMTRTLDDGNVAVSSMSTLQASDCLRVVKVDRLGNMVWSRFHSLPYGVSVSNVVMLADGFLILGNEYDDQGTRIWGLKLNAYGLVQWARIYEASLSTPVLAGVVPTSDGYLLVAQSFVNYTSDTLYVTQVDRFGEYAGSFRILLQGVVRNSLLVAKAPGDGLAVYGGQYVTGQYNDFLLITDGLLQPVAYRALDPIFNNAGFATLGTGSYIVGWTTVASQGGSEDFGFSRFSEIGDFLGTHSVGTGADEALVKIVPATDGGFMLVGNRQADANHTSDLQIFRCNQDGELISSLTIGSDLSETAVDACLTESAELVIAGTAINTESNASLWIARTGTPPIRPEVTRMEFGETQTLTVVQRDVILFNTTNSTQRIHTVWVPEGFRCLTDLPLVISPHFSATLTVRFQPHYTGEFSGYMTLFHQADARPVEIFTHGNSVDDIMTDWSRTYGDYQPQQARVVRQTSDGGFILGGATTPPGQGNGDFMVVRTDSVGSPLWQRVYGGHNDEECRDILCADDGGFLLAGKTASYGAGGGDFWLVKIGPNGALQWSETYGGTQSEQCQSIIQSSDGGYLLSGATMSFGAGGWDFWLVKADQLGTMEWSRTFGGLNYEGCQGGNSHDGCQRAIECSNGDFLLAGWTSSFQGGVADGLLIRTSAAGDSLWSLTLGGEGHDTLYTVLEATDGSFVAAGYTRLTPQSSRDFWWVSVTPEGTIMYDRTYGGAGDEVCWSMVQTSDDGFVLAGTGPGIESDDTEFHIKKVNLWGDLEWERTVGGPDRDGCRSVVETRDGGLAAAGYTFSFGAGASDFWLVKLVYEDLEALPLEPALPERVSLHPAYPNPFNATTTIGFELPGSGMVDLAIFDLLGRRVATLSSEVRPAGIHHVQWTAENVASGIYFARLQAAQQISTQKVVLLK